MNALVKEWISKAEGDLVCVRRECRARKEQLQLLDAYSVAFRYPGASANRDIALTAQKYYQSVRTACRIQLHLPT